MTATPLAGPAERAEAWARDNQRHLVLTAAAVAARLDGRAGGGATEQQAADVLAAGTRTTTGRPVAVERLAELFGLTRFERDLLVAAIASDLGLPAAVGPVTFNRALACLPDPHWSALLPDGPLRRWRLIDVPPQLPPAEIGGLGQVPLAADERILHALAGADTVDERLTGRARAVGPYCRLAGGQLPAVAQLAALVAGGPAGAALLHGEDRLTRRQAAVAAADALGLSVLAADAGDVPDDPPSGELFARLLAREAGLGGRLLLIEAAPETVHRARRLLATPAPYGVPTVVSVDEPVGGTGVPAVALPPVTAAERAALFAAALAAAGLPAAAVSAEHRLTPAAIALAVDRAGRLVAADGHADVDAAAAALADRPLHGLARVRRPGTALADLVLPESAARALRALLAHVRQRDRVHDWGFGDRARGLAVTALFAGPSGTGKTTAAEAVAAELGRQVVAVDLAEVVSKYVGETEKNLARLFDAAESGAVLLFDEGDALFGRRTQVRDSRDRYANLEVSYLLQRLETFSGIAIVTTNAREAIDPAFLRRMRFVVTFEFPDAAQRALLWRRAFPPGAPTKDLSHERLAQLAVAGGTITQLALHAAFLAADAGEPVAMAHVLAAAQIECDKLERPLSPQETKGWVP